MFVGHLYHVMRSILYVKEMYDATAIKRIKTETRRTHGLSRINEWPSRYIITGLNTVNDFLCVTFTDVHSSNFSEVNIKSRFKIGETLYLAEPMWIITDEQVKKNLTALDVPHLYHWEMTDQQLEAAIKLKEQKRWKKISPLLMRQEYGRHFIKILDVGCERVQDISDEAVVREGISPPSTELKPGVLKAMYASLFDKVNKPGLWDLNPYVFVYQFEYLPEFKRRLHQC